MLHLLTSATLLLLTLLWTMGVFSESGSSLAHLYAANSSEGNIYCSPRADGGGIANGGGLWLDHVTMTKNEAGQDGPHDEVCTTPGQLNFVTSIPLIAHQPAPCTDFVPACNLTHHPKHDFHPSWSPDGQKIAFTRADFDAQSSGIYLMNPDGSMAKQLRDFGYQPFWSPDGSKIAFIESQNGYEDIYVMDANGANPISLTNSAINKQFIAWSPDGSKILYQEYEEDNAHQYLYLMNANGSQKKELATDVGVSVFPWSADGNRIIFSYFSGPSGSGPTIFQIMNIDGSNPITFTLDEQVGLPLWSPDANKIAYQCDGYSDICVMNSDGSQRSNLTNDELADYSPVWSPDGSRLLFLRYYSPTDYTYDLAVINAGGGEITRLTNSPSGNGISEAVWSPDGSKIAFTRGDLQNRDIYVVEIEE